MKGSRAITRPDIEKLMKYFLTRTGKFSLRNATLFILGVNTGFRISEILSLKVKDVIHYNKQSNSFGNIQDIVTVQKKYMKNKKESRSVIIAKPIKNRISIYLENWHNIYSTKKPRRIKFSSLNEIQKLNPEHPLFPSDHRRNKRPTTIRKKEVKNSLGQKIGMEKIVENSKIASIPIPKLNLALSSDGPEEFLCSITAKSVDDIFKKAFMDCEISNHGTHSMRKTYSETMFKDTGRDIFLLMKILGHKNINSTIQYINPDFQKVEDAQRALDFLSEGDVELKTPVLPNFTDKSVQAPKLTKKSGKQQPKQASPIPIRKELRKGKNIDMGLN